ncbi:MarR family winged helix-turn-helix transcriptional regulator [Luminiphilus syltensis]|uniref:MarR family winged helix-turn-helix transcriptional regulator n=1 Tax=Luminiphilus syltensis TaxID=1341119 RepID=UPI00059035BE|nr:MarR family winged helix-turn-helix transcriptional regulator [Luminiphilus syltensis]
MKSEEDKPINLKAFIPYRLTRISEDFGKMSAQGYKKYNVTSPEWRILAILTEYGSASSKFLQDQSALSRSRVNRTLDKLVSKKWVSRKFEEYDRRQNKITLTTLGISTFAEAARVVNDMQSEWLRNFSKTEISQLYKLMEKLEDQLP